MSEAARIRSILLEPLQVRRNQGSVWIAWVIVALLVLPPLGCAVAGLFDPVLLRVAAGLALGLIGLPACLLFFGLAGALRRQANPLALQLVPGQGRSLGHALIAAWLGCTLFAGLASAPLVAYPLGVATGVAGGLALMARVPGPVWLVPIVGGWIAGHQGMAWIGRVLGPLLVAAWLAAPALWTVLVFGLGAYALQSLPPTLGQFRALQARLRRGAVVASPRAAAEAKAGRRDAAHRRWLDEGARLMQPGSTPLARTTWALCIVMPWRNRAAWASRAIAFAAVVAIVATPWPHAALLVRLVVVLCIVVCGHEMLAGPSLNVYRALAATRREQALVMLLPGMPRGGALGRALALAVWRATAISWITGVLLLAALVALLTWMTGAGAPAALVMRAVASTTLASLLAAGVACRPWARVSFAARSIENRASLMIAGLSALLLLASLLGWLWPFAVLVPAASAAWCAWRWRRMAAEPSAWPAGRLRG